MYPRFLISHTNFILNASEEDDQAFLMGNLVHAVSRIRILWLFFLIWYLTISILGADELIEQKGCDQNLKAMSGVLFGHTSIERQ